MPSTPYMKLYIGDYLGDTSHLSTIQHGAYLLLIMAYWQKGGCIRNADAMLRQCTRTTEEEWAECKEIVLEFFEEREGFLYHNRIDKELHKRAVISGKSKIAADKRWGKIDADALPTHMPTHMPTQCERNATPRVHIKDININNIPDDADALPTHKHKYGSEKNVLLTDGQYSNLVTDLGEPMALACIEKLSSEKALHGYKYKRDDLAIRKWVIDAVKEKGMPAPALVLLPTKKENLPICPVCGTTGLRARESLCPKCHFLLEPDCINNPEIVAEWKADWEQRAEK